MRRKGKLERKRKIVAPRPARAHKRRRVALLMHMHPSQLEDLEERARGASMSLGNFVSALLFNDEPETCRHGVPLDSRPPCLRCHDVDVGPIHDLVFVDANRPRRSRS